MKLLPDTKRVSVVFLFAIFSIGIILFFFLRIPKEKTIYKIGEEFPLSEKHSKVTIIPENVQIKLLSINDTREECRRHECFIEGTVALKVSVIINRLERGPYDFNLRDQGASVVLIRDIGYLQMLRFVDWSKEGIFRITK